jgi:ankyrin repeat protein
MDKEKGNAITVERQTSARWLSGILTSTRSGSAVLLILLIVIVIGILIYFLMASAVFKSEFPEERPKAERKMDTEEEFITSIKSIIEKGEDINAEQNRNKRTLLHLAAKKGYAKAVKLLLDNNADINARDVMDATPLELAMLEDKIEIVHILITYGADLNAKSRSILSTPLHNAAMFGKVEIAKLLLENGADINAKNMYGFTPLKAAMISLEDENFMKTNNTTPEKQREIIEILRTYGGKE